MCINRMKSPALFLLGLTVFLVAGCFSPNEAPSDAPVKPTPATPKAQTAQNNGGWDDFPNKNNGGWDDFPNKNNGGWDDFPNKYRPTLLDLDSNAPRLPMPLGTRYAALASGNPAVLSKAAAGSDACQATAAQFEDAPCPGDSTVFMYQSPVRDLFLYDTITYYDNMGIAHCSLPGGNRAVERHVRRIVEVGVGEAWETIRDSITDMDVFPRHTLHGTGRIQLESGQELAIRSYDMTLLTQFGTWNAYIVDASLELVYKDDYVIRLALAKPHPYQAIDLFPVDRSSEYGVVMSGPITHAGANGGTDTVGYVDLFDDHTFHVRDWTGAPVAN